MKNAHKKEIPNWFKTKPGILLEKEILWLEFDNDRKKIKILLLYTKIHSINTCPRQYYVENTPQNRKLFGIESEHKSKTLYAKIDPINWPEMKRYKSQLILQGLSKNTQKSYVTEFAQLLQILKNHPVRELSAEKLRSYILYCHQVLHLSENLIHSRINALKFYFEKVLHQQKIFFDIPRPKKPLLLPKALSYQEVRKIIEVTDNLKHRLIIKLCYGMGLRVSEVVALKIEDINSDRMQVLIHRAKGKKDRYVNLPHATLEDLRNYYKEYRPKIYLFEGQDGNQYSIRAAQSVFKTAMKKAGIHKNVGIHTLRHSYATHLLEYGTDISLIQKLLGHNNIKTTLIYAQVSNNSIKNVESPLDKI